MLDSRPVSRAARTLILVVAVAAQSGCIYDPKELTVTYSVSIQPQQFCTGERLHVSYSGSGEVDWIRVLGAHGGELLLLDDGQRAGMTEPVRAEWLPLSSVTKLKNGDEFEQSLEDHVTCIDRATWVDYASTWELRGDEAERELVDTVQELDTETGSVVDVNIYDVYMEFYGFRWSIPREDFGNRAHLLRLRNAGDRTMEFSATSVWGDQYWTLGPGEVASLPTPSRPWLTIEARYRPKKRRLTAWQKGEITKPENEHFLLIDLYEQVEYRLQLEVVCVDVDQ